MIEYTEDSTRLDVCLGEGVYRSYSGPPRDQTCIERKRAIKHGAGAAAVLCTHATSDAWNPNNDLIVEGLSVGPIY